MPFEARGSAAKRIAVIGGGISGMGAAYHLSQDAHVVLFEAEDRLGGHARTVMAGKNGDQPVDTGFIVFNYPTYPHLAALFKALDVPVMKSDMSFGVSARGGRLEYALNSVDTIFAQRSNLARPAFLRMLGDIQRFNREAMAAARPEMTIRDLIAKLGLGPWFTEYYLTPFSGAIWSTPKRKILDFPAEAMVRFFKNHGILDWHENHQWYTVKGGSVEYVRRLQAAIERRGVDVRLGAETRAVRRRAFGADVRCEGAEWEPFDDVVFATHSDDTLRLLSDPTGVERTALSAVRYQPNKAVLHCDTAVMPKRRKAWASWSYVETGNDPDRPIDLSYWMNSLQSIPMDDPHFVTLNRDAPIREESIYDECVFRHPVFDAAALAAQDTIRAINGQNRTWFCGAWLRHGFHEDGLATAAEVAGEITAESQLAMAAE
ncbi:MAG: FAD-dependent oxidoreductase [Silicimonas sp.]|nr:FAD-dependent oxidoreductase [Silicimonas sp.]NNL73277.1 FAD-dependent oxidoreductase [Silicimonas sp.]